MRPNLFANTPDILHEYLQIGGRPAFMIRLVLAATLGATYGIYGPPFEQCVGTPVRPGSEEYLDSEKYQVRHWDLDAPGACATTSPGSTRSAARTPRLHYNRNLRFFAIDNDQIICYGKSTPDLSNLILVGRQPRPVSHAVGLGAAPRRTSWAWAPGPGESYQVHDLISDAPLPLARRDELRRARPPASAPRTSSGSAGRSRPSNDFDYYHV